MYRRILIGCDGSDHARDALALGSTLACATGASLALGCSIPHGPSYLPVAAVGRRWREEAKDVLKQFAAAVPDGIDVARELIISVSAAGGLAMLAESEDADLIVVGSSHRSGLGRVLVGTVGQQVFDSAPCAVAIAPAGLRHATSSGLRRIGVGVDGKPESAVALTAARELAGAAGGSLCLLCVAPAPQTLWPAFAAAPQYEQLHEAAREQAQAILNDAVESASGETDVEASLGEGPVGRILVEMAVESKLDLLVVGSRGFGPLRRVLPGSVSAHLIGHSPCAVIVVPRPGDPPPATEAGGMALGRAARA